VARLTADLRAAQWNLDQTTVRAPADGFVTYLALRPGQRVLSMPFQPAMTFVDTSERIVGVQLHQIYLRHVAPGQPVELTFKTRPGHVFSGTVEAVLEVTAGAQAQIGGTVPLAARVHAEPFFVRVALDDEDHSSLPPGAAGTAAIYTGAVTPTHIIRKVMIRMDAIVNYVWPGL
jgi:multidrug resistance efflux pump